ncbi:uncharacterized protein LOC143280177 [Babylonia areolata]|uniref:uncharacterized protein LOC143280177 n=1 Tax=Babylonia areolata TaxID=304850 RepID=UPI003FD23054
MAAFSGTAAPPSVVSMPVLVSLLLLLVSLSCLVTPGRADASAKDAGVEKMEVETEKKYCSFFNNRAPEVQRNLKNCTWFKESSCCRQEEIDATFGRVKPLRGASLDCQRYTNYLMCYICSPDQYLFYLMESLTVCEEFCQSWFEACQTAILKGSVIKTLYENGKDFCESRRFKVDTVKNGKCFFFDARMDKNGAGGGGVGGTVGRGVWGVSFSLSWLFLLMAAGRGWL